MNQRPTSDPVAGRRRFLSASAWTLGLATGGIGVVGCSSVARPAAPSTPTNSTTASAADIGYLTDMTAHHGQALVMCQRVLGQDIGIPVKAASIEVLQNQAIEIGTMRAWLTDWGASTAPPETVMAWMGVNDGNGMPLAMMPGLATDGELAELSQLAGLAQGRKWLELMLVHHTGGVAMAEAAAGMVSSSKVARLASAQAAVQTWEIKQYEILLSTTYAA